MSAAVAGGYVLGEAVGFGSTATVYRAARDGETVAVKVLHPHLSRDPTVRGRFLREVSYARRLSHPSIVRIFDLVTPQDPGEPPALVMEYCQGGNLVGYRIADPRGLERLAREVGGALQAAHAEGIVHRDLKPSNILRDGSGAYKVCDFGSAGVQDSVSLSTSSLFLDAPFYVAPEVFEGHPADPRSDLYSLGAILYEAVTGRKARERALPLGVGDQAPERAPLERVLPVWLADLVLKLLGSLDRRPPDALSFLRELERRRGAAGAPVKKCLFCGAALPLRAPVCLACGQEEIGLSRPEPREGYGVTLRSIREDTVTLGRVTDILRGISGDPGFELELMFGDPRYYSREERKRKRRLPTRLVGDLTRRDAERLKGLFDTLRVRTTVHEMRGGRRSRLGPLVGLRAPGDAPAGRGAAPGPMAPGDERGILTLGLAKVPQLGATWTRDLASRLIFAIYDLEEASRSHELGDLVRPFAQALHARAARLMEDLGSLESAGLSRADLAAEVTRAAAATPGSTNPRLREALEALEKHEEAERRRADFAGRALRLCGRIEGMAQDLRSTEPDRETEVRRAFEDLEAELNRQAGAPPGPDKG